MKLSFPYLNDRPTLTARLSYGKNKARFFELLIDTGADYTLISKSDAYLLGINFEEIKAEEFFVEVVNLEKMKVKKVKLNLEIEKLNFKIPVLISEKETECLLGRRGIFEVFDVLFQETKKQ